MCRRTRIGTALGAAHLWLTVVAGCSVIPVQGHLDTHARVDGSAEVRADISATLQGPIEVRLPPVPDLGPIVGRVVRAGRGEARIGLIDVDGLLLSTSRSGPYLAGENPVAAFREKLEAAAQDPGTRAVVLRINSPGGSVTACDILAEELRRFRVTGRKPVVACLMDLGTSGAYYLAVGADRLIAHPTTVTGGIGAVLNRYNLMDAMAQFNVIAEPVKSSPRVDLGTMTEGIDEASDRLLRSMVDDFATRFRNRVAAARPGMTGADWSELEDGRVVTASQALSLHLIDRIGYLPDAIAEAEGLARVSDAQVVAFSRRDVPARTIYDTTPSTPIQAGLVPFSLPGLEREKLPTFLYLWAPDPTIVSRSSP